MPILARESLTVIFDHLIGDRLLRLPFNDSLTCA